MQCPKCDKEIGTLHIDDYVLEKPKIVLNAEMTKSSSPIYPFGFQPFFPSWQPCII